MMHVCNVTGCPNTTPCQTHPPASWAPDHQRGTKAERGYGKAWQQARRQTLKARPLCPCGTPATTVDHITPLAEGGAPLDAGNLQPLCAACHQLKTNADAARGRARARRNQR